jgi:hypothetical protein
MPYVPVSVGKTGANPGRPKGKDPNIMIIRTSDINVFPARDANGVKNVGGQSLTLKEGANAIEIYATPSTIKRFDAIEGEDDAKGWIPNVEFAHPGDEVAFEEWKENNVNENLVVVTSRRGFTDARIHGTPDEPMQFEVEEQDDKDGLKTTVKLKGIMRGPKSMRYTGTKPTVDTGSGGEGGV